MVPALVGGMTVAVQEGSRVCYSKVRVPGNLRFVVWFPGSTLDTSSARQALPTAYSRDDAVFNLSRAAMLVSCLQNGEAHEAGMATESNSPAFQDETHTWGTGECSMSSRRQGLLPSLSTAGARLLWQWQTETVTQRHFCKR